MKPSLSTVILAALVSAASGGCSSTPPPGWQQGGGALSLQPVRWVNGDLVIDVGADGDVHVNGDFLFAIDAAGRVYGPDDEPRALLAADGTLTGTNGRSRGWVGGYEAFLPGGDAPWIRLHRGGLLLRYDDTDEGRPFGMWVGCDDPRVMQTCTLVSHLVGLELRLRQQRMTPRVGVGVGVGVGFP